MRKAEIGEHRVYKTNARGPYRWHFEVAIYPSESADDGVVWVGSWTYTKTGAKRAAAELAADVTS